MDVSIGRVRGMTGIDAVGVLCCPLIRHRQQTNHHREQKQDRSGNSGLSWSAHRFELRFNSQRKATVAMGRRIPAAPDIDELGMGAWEAGVTGVSHGCFPRIHADFEAKRGALLLARLNVQ